MVGRIFWFFWQTLWNFNSNEMLKKISPLAPLHMLAHKICIWCISDFGQFWPRLGSVFPSGNFWFCRKTLATFRDQSAMPGEHLSKKKSLEPPYNPKVGQKRGLGGQKICRKSIWPFSSTGRLNLWGKHSEPKKQIAKIFCPFGATRAWSSNLWAAKFPHYNSDPVKRVS